MIQRTYPEQLARVPYMKGYIYIAGGFGTVNRSTCGQKGSLVDNDPHFWTQPPTWGICRNDLRASANVDDVVFFVLPRNGRLPQSIFGYLTIERIITHSQAYATPSLKADDEQDAKGQHHCERDGRVQRPDRRDHEHIFHKIKLRYAVGNVSQSRLLTPAEICKLVPSFVEKISQVLGKSGSRPIDIISRWGAFLSPSQVNELLAWLKPDLTKGGLTRC